MLQKCAVMRRWAAGCLLLSSGLTGCADFTGPGQSIEVPDGSPRFYIPINEYQLDGITVIGKSQDYVPCSSTPDGCLDPERPDTWQSIWMNTNGVYVTEAGAGDSDVNHAAAGPMAWGACVLTVSGVHISMLEVAQELENALSAQRDFDMYARILQSSLSQDQRLYYQELYYQAEGAVRSTRRALGLKMGASILVVGLATVACSPAMILPTA